MVLRSFRTSHFVFVFSIIANRTFSFQGILFRQSARPLSRFSSSSAEQTKQEVCPSELPAFTNSSLAKEPAAKRKYSWIERVAHLAEFRREFGHTIVPKRYSEYGNLGLWVNKQRQNYRKLKQGISSPLTQQQIDILNELDFCWDATNVRSPFLSREKKEDPEDVWRASYHRLATQVQASGQKRVALAHLSPKVRQWLATQQQELTHGSMSNVTMQRILALRDLDPAWHLDRRDLLWEVRFQELVAYRKKFGDVNVPITYENKQLAHWVSTQRKQFNLRQRREPSNMTSKRIARLEAIGFVWNHWDDAFEKKNVYRELI